MIDYSNTPTTQLASEYLKLKERARDTQKALKLAEKALDARLSPSETISLVDGQYTWNVSSAPITKWKGVAELALSLLTGDALVIVEEFQLSPSGKSTRTTRSLDLIS